ncbi:hypothetical protein HYZ64_02845 [Candidatus Berkelbacteria bacterium]|nr:hypothetical protein [Candidatus Berkelbacteria bacterium]
MKRVDRIRENLANLKMYLESDLRRCHRAHEEEKLALQYMREWERQARATSKRVSDLIAHIQASRGMGLNLSDSSGISELTSVVAAAEAEVQKSAQATLKAHTEHVSAAERYNRQLQSHPESSSLGFTIWTKHQTENIL